MTSTAKEFIKLTEVKEIVQDMVIPLLNAMKLREQEAIDFKNQVVIIKDDLKKQRADVRQALLLRNTVNEHHKSLKSISKKQELADQEIDNLGLAFDVKINKLHEELDLNKREQ